MRNMKNGEKSVAAVDGLYRSVRKVMCQTGLAFPIGHALRDELGLAQLQRSIRAKKKGGRK